MVAHYTMEPLFIAFSTVDTLGVMLTLFRLLFRLQIRRFWWEDVWAAVMVVCGTAFTVGQMVSLETVNYKTAFVTSWMTTLAFTSTLWATRMSLLYANIRITSPLSVLRKITRVMAVLFFLFWATIIALKISTCAKHTKPRFSLGKMRPGCALSKVEIFFAVIVDCISDAALVNLSLKLLWRVKLPRRQRRMILCLFSSSVVMSVFSLLHAVFQLVPSPVEKYISMEMELTLALIVCNLLVVVTYVYRMILSSHNGTLPSESESSSEDDDFTTPVPTNATTQLTTVDLDVTLGTSMADSDSAGSVSSP